MKDTDKAIVRESIHEIAKVRISKYGALAQLGEHYPCKVDVVRSNRICSIEGDGSSVGRASG